MKIKTAAALHLSMFNPHFNHNLTKDTKGPSSPTSVALVLSTLLSSRCQLQKLGLKTLFFSLLSLIGNHDSLQSLVIDRGNDYFNFEVSERCRKFIKEHSASIAHAKGITFLKNFEFTVWEQNLQCFCSLPLKIISTSPYFGFVHNTQALLQSEVSRHDFYFMKTPHSGLHCFVLFLTTSH